MLKNNYTKTERRGSLAIAYLLTGSVIAAIWKLFTIAVLLKLESIPIIYRAQYDNEFVVFLATTLFFLLVSLVLSQTLFSIFKKLASSIFLKIVVGSLTCLLPVVCLGLFTFGLGLSSPAMQTWYAAMVMAGGLLPVVQNVVLSFFNRKAQLA